MFKQTNLSNYAFLASQIMYTHCLALLESGLLLFPQELF